MTGRSHKAIPSRLKPKESGAYKCLECAGSTVVTDSRPIDGRTRRRRACMNCGLRFTTLEVPEISQTVFDELRQAQGALTAALAEVARILERET